MDVGTGMGGVLSSFYIAPPQQTHFPPQLQMQMHLPPPLPLPPPPLASVRVPVLRHLFTDIPIAPAGGTARGRGTPVDVTRKAAWGGDKVGSSSEDGEGGGSAGPGPGRGTLERRQPHPRPRPHPMYLAMARAVESERASYGGGVGGPVEGVVEEDLPPMPLGDGGGERERESSLSFALGQSIEGTSSTRSLPSFLPNRAILA
ncbi:hypothetical protein K438DRAFT_662700 [Mycena galopus ATCC 62051]|nr:hypothetical protein K438DRAFT_662700 [Mycena galopus ATCC 62051]